MQAYFAERLDQLGLIDADVASAVFAAELSTDRVQSTLGLIGLGSLLFASSIFFLAFTDAINVIWKVPVGSGVWNSVQRRLIAFLMVLITGGVLIAGVAVGAVVGAAEPLSQARSRSPPAHRASRQLPPPQLWLRYAVPPEPRRWS